MLETIVKKIIARDGAREIVDSSQEEMQHFVVEQCRPDFDDDEILCIKFLVSDSESSEETEESSWFINPYYAKDMPIFNCCNMDDETSMEYFSILGFTPLESYGPKMAAEFLPELLIISTEDNILDILEEYQAFYNELLDKNLTSIPDEEKYNMFLQRIRRKHLL